VVTDLMLPHLAGVDLARRILDHDPKRALSSCSRNPPFNGLRDEDLLKRFDLLRWPVQPSALMQAIQTALARIRTGTESEESS